MKVENKGILDAIRKKRCQGRVEATIPRESRSSVPEREAVLQVRYVSYAVKRPRTLNEDGMDRAYETVYSVGLPGVPRLILWVKFSLKGGVSPFARNCGPLVRLYCRVSTPPSFAGLKIHPEAPPPKDSFLGIQPGFE
jgi:hypothetical protein